MSCRKSARVFRDARDQQIVLGRGYDHNFVLRGGVTEKPKLAVRLEDQVSGRVLELWTTEPGVQVYTGNFLTAQFAGERQDALPPRRRDLPRAAALPDSPNQPKFPSTRLDPGKTYRQFSIFKFSTIGK